MIYWPSSIDHACWLKFRLAELLRRLAPRSALGACPRACTCSESEWNDVHSPTSRSPFLTAQVFLTQKNPRIFRLDNTDSVFELEAKEPNRKETERAARTPAQSSKMKQMRSSPRICFPLLRAPPFPRFFLFRASRVSLADPIFLLFVWLNTFLERNNLPVTIIQD